jgi:hypothetical protein
MSKIAKNGTPAILIMIFLFSSILLLQQGVLALQPNQTSSKNITARVAPQGTTLEVSNKTSAISNATLATPAQTQTSPSTTQPPSSSNGGAPMSSGSGSGTPNMTGFTNAANLTLKDKIFPIKYNITGGKLVGLLPDKDKTTVVAVLSPGGSGEKNMIFTIELPRNVIDSKGQGNTDTKFVVKIDNKGVEYKDLADNLNARILGIDFSKGDRVVEITGTQMTP